MTLRVLVTGGAGYIGSHMVRLLRDAGHRVVVFDNLERGHRDAVGDAQLVEGDLRRPEDIAEAFRGSTIDVVMHFAAYCYVGESVDQPLKYFRNNVGGTLNLLESMARHSVNRLVFSSTCSTYGMPQSTPIAEDHPQSPINPYGASKLMVEKILGEIAPEQGLSSISLRYFNAAGCHASGELGERHFPETHLIPLILAEAMRIRAGGDPAQTTLVVNGDDYETQDGTCIRDYVHVTDLAQAHLAAAEALVDGRCAGSIALNLGSESGYSVLEVIDECRRITGAPIQYRVGPRRPGDPSKLVASSRQAMEVLRWQAEQSSLGEIIGTAWNWFSRQRLA